MSLGDTAAQRGLYKQLNNVLTASPGIQIEVVFHSKAVYAMLKDTGYFKSQILDLHNKGIVFAVCNNSLKARNIDVGRVIPEAVVVPAAIIEIIKKQEEHWSYIKAGN
jgi:intracellular sulfur oxidation DsrE/DsrF family protein